MDSVIAGPTRGLLFTLLVSGQLAAQSGRTVSTIANADFSTGGLHTFLFGDHYRALWATPIEVEVLDLQGFAGGLRPLRRGGGTQTRSLRFEGADGRQYAFRVLRKVPSAVVPVELRGTFVEGVVTDQMSATHPGGALVTAPFLDAVGLLHAPPLLRVMPDDPMLGEFRTDFANTLGTIEERPGDTDEDVPPFAGARDIDGTEAFMRELADRPERGVDARSYLTARLVDLYLGDWDRHEDQWRWALLGSGDSAAWQPIPRDRDQAFARYDGFLLGIARDWAPQLLNFGPKYASPLAMTWNGRNLDRRLLAGLERPVWDSVARFVTSRLTDSVIDVAVGRLPEAWERMDGDRLRQTLRARRDGLTRAATDWYEFLADRVDIHAGDHDDVALVDRAADGATTVRIARRGEDPWFRRTFLPGETGEVRLYLRDGDDRVIIGGEGKGPLLRVVAGSGRDTLVDRSRHRNSRFYDVGDNTVAEGGSVHGKPYVTASDTNPTALPERDWGSRGLTTPRLVVSSDVGFTPGISITKERFGFRRQPWATSLSVAFDFSFLRSSARFDAGYQHHFEQSKLYLTVDVLASGLEALRFYGFGNETAADSLDEYYHVAQDALELSPGLGLNLPGRASAQLRLRIRHSRTNPDNSTNSDGFIGESQPLGYGDFGQVGLQFRLEWDGRDYPLGATRGVHAVAMVDGYPAGWNSHEDAFGSVEGQVATFLSPGSSGWATLALRAGGRTTWGEYPYFEAAYLGGSRTLRGFARNRFAGDASAFGSAELRLRVARTDIILPGEFGLIGLVDGGRVFLDGENSDRWHSDAGGALFYGVLDRTAMMVLGAAGGGEGARVYFGFGMGY